MNPDVIIVCDDYEFETVKEALKDIPKKVFGNYAVILGDVPELPEPVSDFSFYPKLKLTAQEKETIKGKLFTYF